MDQRRVVRWLTFSNCFYSYTSYYTGQLGLQSRAGFFHRNLQWAALAAPAAPPISPELPANLDWTGDTGIVLIISQIVFKVWWRERYPSRCDWQIHSMPPLGSAHLILAFRSVISGDQNPANSNIVQETPAWLLASNWLAFWRSNFVWVFFWHSAPLLNGSTKKPCEKIGPSTLYIIIFTCQPDLW